jgi:hypothetical protein
MLLYRGSIAVCGSASHTSHLGGLAKMQLLSQFLWGGTELGIDDKPLGDDE